MKTLSKSSFPALIVLGVLILNLSNVVTTHASFHEQLVIDAKAISLANAVSADPPEIMSIHYNPAGLSNLPEGRYCNIGFTTAFVEKTTKFKDDPDHQFLVFNLKNDPLDGSEATSDSSRMYVPLYGDPVDLLVAPSLGLSYRKPGSKWTFAIGEYVPFWWGVSHEGIDPARFGAESMYSQHMVYAAPSLSYQMTPTFSFGLSVGFGQSAEGAKMDVRVLNDLMAAFSYIGEVTIGFPNIPIISDLTFPFPWFGGGLGDLRQGIGSLEYDMTDDYSPNFNLGMLWEPKPWFSFGLCYRSEIKSTLTGDYDFRYSQEWQNMVDWFGSSVTLQVISAIFAFPTKGVTRQTGTVTKEVNFPQSIQGGVKLKPLHWLGLMFDLQWTDWSAIKRDRLKFDQNIELLTFLRFLGYPYNINEMVVERHFKDTLNWSVGVEIDPFKWLTLRFGYENRQSSVDKDYFDMLYAVPDLDNYCAGFGIHLQNGMDIDLGFSYLVDKEYSVENGRSPNFNSTEFTDTFYNPYTGLDYEQDTEAYIISLKISAPTSVITQMIGSLF